MRNARSPKHSSGIDQANNDGLWLAPPVDADKTIKSLLHAWPSWLITSGPRKERQFRTGARGATPRDFVAANAGRQVLFR